MFKSFAHFKKTTQNVYNTFKSRPNLKLSEFRQVLLADAGFKNIQSYAGFKNIQSYAASFKGESDLLSDASNENNTQESSEKINIVSVIIQVAGIITEKTDYLDTVKGNIQAHRFQIYRAMAVP